MSHNCTQPKIDSPLNLLRIDCVFNFDVSSDFESDNEADNSAVMAPVVHDRSNMITEFMMPSFNELNCSLQE